MPILRSDPRGVFFFLFFAETNWAKVVHTFSEKSQLTDEKSGQQKRNKKKQSGEVFARAYRRCVAKIHGLNRRNSVDIRRGINLGFQT